MAKLSARRRLPALDSLTAVLRSGEAPPGDWPAIVAVAEELIVTAALARGVYGSNTTPAPVAERLRAWQRGNTLRNARLRRQLLEAVQGLNEAGVTPLLFKGALHLLDGTLSAIGDRYMSDLDLLVPRDQTEPARAALEQLGYTGDSASPFEQPFELGFGRAGTEGPIDLHTEFGDEPLMSVLPAALAWEYSAEVVVDGSRLRALSPTHQVLHNVLHAAVLDRQHAVGGLPLRQLLALADIVRAGGDEVDWGTVAGRMEERGLTQELQAYLWLAHRFTGLSLAPDRWQPPSRRSQWGWRVRAHELRVRTGFALGWPPHLQRNLHYAFGRAYLESLHEPAEGEFSLARARARHAARLVRQDGVRVFRAGTLRRV